MKDHKIVIIIGSAIIGASWLCLAYNFLNMYSLVAKCREKADAQQCQAYLNWVTLNKIGLTVLVIGLVVLAVGLLMRHQNKKHA